MKTVFEHTQSNVLIIPQTLFSMVDVSVIKHHHNSAIFFKNLERNLENVEFYTNTPCFIYIDSGTEVLTNSDNRQVTLEAESSIFIPQGLQLHSDFVKETDALKAYLVFFDDDVIVDFLSKSERTHEPHKSLGEYCLIEKDRMFKAFFQSIHPRINDPAYLKAKLQELLHLIVLRDSSNSVIQILRSKERRPPKQNLEHLLNSLDIIQLTVNDLAHLSGRSVSSFNRDFKDLYQTTPKRWLLDKKLARAKSLLESEEQSVTDIALLVGYENVSNFIKAFKMKYGQTPKQIKG